ncbi:MAG: hypothetical protein ACLUKN_08275 [Bacilli bacterium]
MEKCATEAELTYSLSSAETKDAGKFKIHTITLSSQKKRFKAILKVRRKIAELEPYVTLPEFYLTETERRSDSKIHHKLI